MGVSPLIGLPAASRASRLKGTTSPCRTAGCAGESARLPIWPPSTFTTTVESTPRTEAVIRAVPAACPVMMPSWSTEATPGRAAPPAHRVQRPIVGLGVGNRAEPERLSRDDRGGAGRDLDPHRRSGHAEKLDRGRIHERLGAGHQRDQRERELAHRARDQPHGGVAHGAFALAPQHLHRQHGVGHRLAGLVQRAQREPHRVARGDGAAGGLDLDPLDRSDGMPTGAVAVAVGCWKASRSAGSAASGSTGSSWR